MQLWWEELSDQFLIVRLEGRDVRTLRVLGIEVVSAEGPYPAEHCLISFGHQMLILSLLVYYIA